MSNRLRSDDNSEEGNDSPEAVFVDENCETLVDWLLIDERLAFPETVCTLSQFSQLVE